MKTRSNRAPASPCAQCGIQQRSKTGLCQWCREVSVKPVPACIGCGGLISKHSKTGKCLPCFNLDRYGVTTPVPNQDCESPLVLDPALWQAGKYGIRRYVGDLGRAS